MQNWSRSARFVRDLSIENLPLTPLKAQGNWAPILSSKGLFCFLPLTATQSERLARDFHVYVLQYGRINIAGLNEANMERVASALVQVTSSLPRL